MNKDEFKQAIISRLNFVSYVENKHRDPCLSYDLYRGMPVTKNVSAQGTDLTDDIFYNRVFHALIDMIIKDLIRSLYRISKVTGSIDNPVSASEIKPLKTTIGSLGVTRKLGIIENCYCTPNCYLTVDQVEDKNGVTNPVRKLITITFDRCPLTFYIDVEERESANNRYLSSVEYRFDMIDTPFVCNSYIHFMP